MLTNATRSIPAPAVGYLAQEIPDITVEEVQNVLIESFKKQYLVRINVFYDAIHFQYLYTRHLSIFAI